MHDDIEPVLVLDGDGARWQARLLKRREEPVYHNLYQAYEAAFSVHTGKDPDGTGIWARDTECSYPETWPVFGYIVYDGTTPAGFVVLEDHGNESGAAARSYDVHEFFVIPTRRRSGIGRRLAVALFDRFPGEWTVKQLPTAAEARAFWRAIIRTYTDGRFSETEIVDPKWGAVTCQRFTTGGPGGRHQSRI